MKVNKLDLLLTASDKSAGFSHQACTEALVVLYDLLYLSVSLATSQRAGFPELLTHFLKGGFLSRLGSRLTNQRRELS